MLMGKLNSKKFFNYRFQGLFLGQLLGALSLLSLLFIASNSAAQDEHRVSN